VSALKKLSNELIFKDSMESPLKDLKTLNDCITLARNILHIPDEIRKDPENSGKEAMTTTSNSAGALSAKPVKRQNQILWNLFANNLDSVVIKLITSPNLPHW
jgi:hypothetical protein